MYNTKRSTGIRDAQLSYKLLVHFSTHFVIIDGNTDCSSCLSSFKEGFVCTTSIVIWACVMTVCINGILMYQGTVIQNSMCVCVCVYVCVCVCVCCVLSVCGHNTHTQHHTLLSSITFAVSLDTHTQHTHTHNTHTHNTHRITYKWLIFNN